jgi:hypothetical protein
MLSTHRELNLIGVKEFEENEDMYKIVDFLNKNLKEEGYIFGLTKKENKNTISIYKTEKYSLDVTRITSKIE